MEFASCHPSGPETFEMTPSRLENLCTQGVERMYERITYRLLHSYCVSEVHKLSKNP
jgi:hypothetical protein